eukprot:119626_1
MFLFSTILRSLLYSFKLRSRFILTFCLIFSIFCPLILPLIVCILKWNELIYYYMIIKLNWNINFSPHNIELKFLYFGLILQNVFTFLFLFHYGHFEYGYVLSIAFICILSLIYGLIFIITKTSVSKSMEPKLKLFPSSKKANHDISSDIL